MYKVQILASRESKARKYLLIPKDTRIEIVENFTDYNSEDEEQMGLANEETERKKLIPLFSPRFAKNKPSEGQKTVTTDFVR